MRGFSKISMAAALAGLTVSGCSEKKEQPAAPAPAETPAPKVYIPPTPREVREAFETVANSHAAPVQTSPPGNRLYTVNGDISLHAEPDVHAPSLKTVSAGSCLQLVNGQDAHNYAKVDIVGQGTRGWISKRALRPAPECKTP